MMPAPNIYYASYHLFDSCVPVMASFYTTFYIFSTSFYNYFNTTAHISALCTTFHIFALSHFFTIFYISTVHFFHYFSHFSITFFLHCYTTISIGMPPFIFLHYLSHFYTTFNIFYTIFHTFVHYLLHLYTTFTFTFTFLLHFYSTSYISTPPFIFSTFAYAFNTLCTFHIFHSAWTTLYNDIKSQSQARRKRCGMSAVAAPKICRERERKGKEGREEREKRRKKREEKKERKGEESKRLRKMY